MQNALNFHLLECTQSWQNTASVLLNVLFKFCYSHHIFQYFVVCFLIFLGVIQANLYTMSKATSNYNFDGMQMQWCALYEVHGAMTNKRTV